MATSAPIGRWATDTLAADPDEVWRSLEHGFPIRLITTFDLKTCDVTRALIDVLADRELQAFDHIPVVEEGQIIGLIDRGGFLQKADVDRSLSVRAAMQPLAESILISAEAGILSFIESAISSPCRLVVDRTRVSGIVTISDLQQLPVRPVIFLLVTQVELLMAHVIRAIAPPDHEWLTWVNATRREKIKKKSKALSRENLAIDLLSATDFCDKRDILWRLRQFETSRAAFMRGFHRIERLRNSVAHAGDYALTRERAIETVQAVTTSREWIKRLLTMRSSQ